MDFGIWNILAIALGLAGVERQFVPSPDHEQWWLLFTHPLLPLWIGVHIGSVVVEKIALDLSLSRAIKKVKLIGPEVWIVTPHVWIVSDMPRSRGLERQEICAQCDLVDGAICPKSPACFPICTQAVVVGDGVLDDKSLNPLRMCQRHAKPDRATVILHIERVARESKRLSEMVHYFRVMVERIGEFLRIRPVAVSETWIVRRNQVIAIG